MAWLIPIISSGREHQIQSDHNDGARDVHSFFPEGVIHTVNQDRADDSEVNRPDPPIRSPAPSAKASVGQKVVSPIKTLRTRFIACTSFNRFPRLYRRGPQLITSGARPAAQDLALTPVFTDGELPLE